MEIEERVIAVIKKNLDKKYVITIDSHLTQDLNVDSFDKLMLIAAFEDEFSISIDEEDFKDFVTVDNIVNKLKEKNIT